jgi:TatA/E family protein of Tat protein translocase
MSPIFSILAFLDIGGGEMIVIFLLVLLLFGGQRMPELARGLGKSIREFKKATSGVEEQIRQAIEEAPEKTAPKKALTPGVSAQPALPPAAATPSSSEPATPPAPFIPPDPNP